MLRKHSIMSASSWRESCSSAVATGLTMLGLSAGGFDFQESARNSLLTLRESQAPPADARAYLSQGGLAITMLASWQAMCTPLVDAEPSAAPRHASGDQPVVCRYMCLLPSHALLPSQDVRTPHGLARRPDAARELLHQRPGRAQNLQDQAGISLEHTLRGCTSSKDSKLALRLLLTGACGPCVQAQREVWAYTVTCPAGHRNCCSLLRAQGLSCWRDLHGWSSPGGP